MYSTPPCPSLAASTAAYRRRSFSDSHPKNRCIFCSTSAAYPSMPHSLIQHLLRGKDTTASAIREVILDHILTRPDFHTAAQQHVRGKLTIQEKLALLFDAGTFVEDLVPSPDLEPRHGARRLVTGHGHIQGRLVAA